MPRTCRKVRRTEDLFRLVENSPPSTAHNLPRQVQDDHEQNEVKVNLSFVREKLNGTPSKVRSPLAPLNRDNKGIEKSQDKCEQISLVQVGCLKNRKIVKATRMLRSGSTPKQQNNVPASAKRRPLVRQQHVEEDSENADSDVLVTTLKDAISPSTSSTKGSPSSSPKSESFQFDCSEEDLSPSTNGSVGVSRRRTYELDISVTDVLLLKSLSEKDSTRMSSGSDSPNLFSKVTLRRKYEKATSVPLPVKTPQRQSTPLAWTPRGKGSTLSNAKTPISTRKCNSLLKNVLNAAVPPCQTVSTIKKFQSNVKMPNFATIHQKAFASMEDISQYKQRREERARLLLSGMKPASPKTPIQVSKKQLRFAADTSERQKPELYIPLPSTPIPLKRLHRQSTDSPRIPLSNHVTPQKEKVGLKKALTPFSIINNGKTLAQKDSNTFKFDVPNSVTAKEEKKVSNTFKFDVPNSVTAKEEKKCGLARPNNFTANKKFEFCRIPIKQNKKEEIKAIVVNKSKGVKNTMQARRYAIKGVRSNRRFDLLMDMRKGK